MKTQNVCSLYTKLNVLSQFKITSLVYHINLNSTDRQKDGQTDRQLVNAFVFAMVVASACESVTAASIRTLSRNLTFQSNQ